MSCVTFAFAAYMDSNLVPFNADLIFGNKKKWHWPRSGEYGGCSNKVILGYKKTIIFAWNFDLLCCASFCPGEMGLLHCMDWCLLSGSYWKNHVSSQFITFSKMFVSFQCFEECQHKCSFIFHFVQEWGVSLPSLSTLFSCWNCYVKPVKQFPCQC